RPLFFRGTKRARRRRSAQISPGQHPLRIEMCTIGTRSRAKSAGSARHPCFEARHAGPENFTSQERMNTMTNDRTQSTQATHANDFPTESFDAPAAAVARLSAIYEANTAFLRDAFARYRRQETFTHRV